VGSPEDDGVTLDGGVPQSCNGVGLKLIKIFILTRDTNGRPYDVCPGRMRERKKKEKAQSGRWEDALGKAKSRPGTKNNQKILGGGEIGTEAK